MEQDPRLEVASNRSRRSILSFDAIDLKAQNEDQTLQRLATARSGASSGSGRAAAKARRPPIAGRGSLERDDVHANAETSSALTDEPTDLVRRTPFRRLHKLAGASLAQGLSASRWRGFTRTIDTGSLQLGQPWNNPRAERYCRMARSIVSALTPDWIRISRLSSA